MCGIAGIIGNNKEKITRNMLQATLHRGPDDSGIYTTDYCSIGMNRLAIIDLSMAAHQPMTSACGRYTIVFNGEVYNFKELKKKLPTQLELKSNSDTEVVLECWAMMQEEVLPELRGMFAFAVWDNTLNTLTIARDHLGIKPIYYSLQNKSLLFCSELKGMLASGMVSKKVNHKALHQYLRLGYIIQPLTILEGVNMLEPGYYLKYQDGQLDIKSFWDITTGKEFKPRNEREAIAYTQKLVVDAVVEETFSDRPLGVFLSGGLDSTVLLAAMKKGGLKDINTFSVGFDQDELSEEEEAKVAADFYETKHTQIQVSEKDVIPHLDDYIKALDQPSVDGLNTWLVSKVTVQHVTVALSGLGGDELFSGYGVDRAIINHQKWKLPAKFISITKPIWEKLPNFVSNRLTTYMEWQSLHRHYAQWGSIFNLKEINNLCGSSPSLENDFYVSKDIGERYDLLQRISYMHLRGFMQNRLLRDSDAVSMAHSLEVRFPLIDSRLVNMSFNLPQSWKLKKLKEAAALKQYEKENSYEVFGVKHILYQAFKDHLPPNFGKRPKRGFRLPIEKWMKGDIIHDLTSTLTSNNTLLSKDAIKQLLHQWEKNEQPWQKIWCIYVLEKWAIQNLK